MSYKFLQDKYSLGLSSNDPKKNIPNRQNDVMQNYVKQWENRNSDDIKKKSKDVTKKQNDPEFYSSANSGTSSSSQRVLNFKNLKMKFDLSKSGTTNEKPHKSKDAKVSQEITNSASSNYPGGGIYDQIPTGLADESNYISSKAKYNEKSLDSEKRNIASAALSKLMRKSNQTDTNSTERNFDTHTTLYRISDPDSSESNNQSKFDKSQPLSLYSNIGPEVPPPLPPRTKPGRPTSSGSHILTGPSESRKVPSRSLSVDCVYPLQVFQGASDEDLDCSLQVVTQQGFANKAVGKYDSNTADALMGMFDTGIESTFQIDNFSALPAPLQPIQIGNTSATSDNDIQKPAVPPRRAVVNSGYSGINRFEHSAENSSSTSEFVPTYFAKMQENAFRTSSNPDVLKYCSSPETFGDSSLMEDVEVAISQKGEGGVHCEPEAEAEWSEETDDSFDSIDTSYESADVMSRREQQQQQQMQHKHLQQQSQEQKLPQYFLLQQQLQQNHQNREQHINPQDLNNNLQNSSPTTTDYNRQGSSSDSNIVWQQNAEQREDDWKRGVLSQNQIQSSYDMNSCFNREQQNLIIQQQQNLMQQLSNRQQDDHISEGRKSVYDLPVNEFAALNHRDWPHHQNSESSDEWKNSNYVFDKSGRRFLKLSRPSKDRDEHRWPPAKPPKPDFLNGVTLEDILYNMKMFQ